MGKEVTFLVSFSGEIGTKRAGTQNALRELTLKNLHLRAKKLKISLEAEEFYGRLKVRAPVEAEKILKSHFGLGRLSRLFSVQEGLCWEEILPRRPFTFEVYVERWISSVHRERALAFKRSLLELLTAEARRRLSLWDNHPPEHLHFVVESWPEGLFLLKEIRPGAPGGFPVGSAGDVLLLFSGGPDSLFSAWLLLRRGLRVALLFFDDEEKGRRELVEETARALLPFYPEGKLLLLRLPYREKLASLKGLFPERERCFFCKTLMLKIGKKLLPKAGAEALATGEILGEQASQTLPALKFLSFQEGLLLRPLITFNKEEVFEKLKEVGLWEEANKKLPPCPFAPRRPRTKLQKNPLKFARILQKLAREVRPEMKILEYRRENGD